jgi:ribulose-5-phosphate 4-epimerase/fuculose-1-phosphate aldolase
MQEVDRFVERMERLPRTILLVNHGIIAIGARHTDVMAALAMAEKSARIFVGAAALGGPVFMDDLQVRRIDGRMDEAYRQRILLQG